MKTLECTVLSLCMLFCVPSQADDPLQNRFLAWQTEVSRRFMIAANVFRITMGSSQTVRWPDGSTTMSLPKGLRMAKNLNVDVWWLLDMATLRNEFSSPNAPKLEHTGDPRLDRFIAVTEAALSGELGPPLPNPQFVIGPCEAALIPGSVAELVDKLDRQGIELVVQRKSEARKPEIQN